MDAAHVTAEQVDAQFFARDVHEVARALLGCLIVRGGCTARIVEVEAYGGAADAASHGRSGKPTRRTSSMFAAPGTIYVYRSYGVHHCLNVVARRGPGGEAAAVLIRAAEPVRGEGAMALRRGLELPRGRRNLLSGPGRLCQALEIGADLDGTQVGEELAIVWGGPVAGEATARVGLNPKTCGEAASWPWRYVETGSRWLSRSR